MNKSKNMLPVAVTNSLQAMLIDEIRQKISATAADAENTSKEKYTAKKKFIESADDMTTREKLDAMDMNYDRRNRERLQNAIWLLLLSITYRFL